MMLINYGGNNLGDADKIKKENTSLQETLAYFLMLYILYCSDDSAWGCTFVNIRNLGIIAIFICMGISALIVHRAIRFCKVQAIALFVVFVVISGVWNRDFSGFSLILSLAIALLFTEFVSFERFCRVYKNVMLIIAVASIAGMLAYNYAPSLLFPTWEFKMGGSTSVLNYIITVIPTGYVNKKIRNYGIFREPAMFSIYLIVAFVMEVQFPSKHQKIREVCLIIALYMTKSMTGYIGFFVLLMFYARQMGYLKKRNLIWMVMLVPFAFFVLQRVHFWDYFMTRLERTGASSHSINSRIASIWVNIYIFLKHPVFGAGAVKSQSLFIDNLSVLGYEKGLTATNMTTYLLASFGVGVCGIFLVGFYRFGKRMEDGGLAGIKFLIVMLLLLCGEVMTYSAFPYVLMFYGYEGSKKTVSINHYIECDNSLI